MIKNKKEVNTTKMRSLAFEIIQAGFGAVDPGILVRNSIKYNDNFNSIEIQNSIYDVLGGRIFVIGGGKAAGKMAEAFESIVGEKNIEAGIVNASNGKYNTKKIKFMKAGHPLPDKNGVKGVSEMLKLKKDYKINGKDLVVCLFSGGASSMLVYPGKGMSLEDKQKTTQALIDSGAQIDEINTVRKHISQIKGGRLAEFFLPAQVATIIISDVVGNDPAVIGSAPTVRDLTTFSDAFSILRKYNLLEKIPAVVLSYIQAGANGQFPDTPKKLLNAKNFIIGKNSNALEAMAFRAANLGLKPMIVSTGITGTSIQAAETIASDILSDEYEKYDCLLYGGETSTSLPVKRGKGGRNQTLAALMTIALKDFRQDWVFSSIASDGRDYIKGIAGAIVDSSTASLPEFSKIDFKKFIREFDVYNLFKRTKQILLKTEETGTNVGDLILFIKK